MDSFIATTPFFSSDHRALADRIAQFVEREAEPHAPDDERDPDQALRDYVLLLAENDLLRYAVATPGEPFDLRALCIVREALSYSSALADLAFVMQGLGTYAISLAATEHVRDFWLARARTGKAIAAFAVTEPDAGSDVAALKTVARRDDDAYIIDGRKRFISNAGVADFYTVFARTGTREDGRAEISAFIVSARMPGFSVAERTDMISPHPIGELELKNCKVPAEDMIGNQGDGLRLSLQTLDMFRASVGAAACGMARRALDESVFHAKAREQFGKHLSEHQLIQEKLAEMATELDAARLLVYRAAYLKDVGAQTSTREASEAKLFATEAGSRIVDQAVQIHGGSGLVRGSVAERLYRDVRALRIYEGTSEIQKLIVANQLLKE
ncbi:MAG TPA: acyl-CoA dehydrogenase family protein [Pyrinomonadaceae bacterium]|nr:acyl-CoA dehydrogenase family protein [Pyrinomonadaceae bacterium]